MYETIITANWWIRDAKSSPKTRQLFHVNFKSRHCRQRQISTSSQSTV